MRAIVTGGAGFIGSHLTRSLLARGDEVALLLRPDSDPWRIADLTGEVLLLDLAAPGVEVAAAGFLPDVMYHLAWSGIHRGSRDDFHSVPANIAVTAAVIELAARSGCAAIVGVGSQAEYGCTTELLDEHTQLRPTTMYGIGKLAAGHLVIHASPARGMRGAWLRLLSTFGPMDQPSYLVPYVIGELLAGRRPSLSSGDQQHDTLYCADVVEALRAAAASESCRGAYVLASGDGRTVRQVAETARDMLAPAAELEFGAPSGHPGWRGSPRRLSADTGWSPSTPLRAGIAETALWCQRHVNGA